MVELTYLRVGVILTPGLFLTAAQPAREPPDLGAAWAVVRGCDTELLSAGEALVDVLARSRTSVTDPTVQAARDRHADALNRHLAALIVAEVEMLERGLIGTDAVPCPANIVEQAEAALRRLPR